jgi:hypothetical protein
LTSSREPSRSCFCSAVRRCSCSVQVSTSTDLHRGHRTDFVCPRGNHE